MAYDTPAVVLGPNDHHVNKDTGSLEPGLGPDQPKPAISAAARIETEARLAGMKAELAAAAKDMTLKEQALARREAEAEAREAALAAREAAQAAREAAGTASTKPSK